jgi:nitroimidazol reductase NimA-like FMN-containing flavoprotein (pyridoxamine 5'-phosphate oxidase superfamily)
MQRPVRRGDKVMAEDRLEGLLAGGYCARIGTVGADGWPYVCPLLYVWREGKVWFHNTAAGGHLKSNVLHDARACFEVDVAGEVFAYGRFACDTSIAYQSLVGFGRITIETEEVVKVEFFRALMAKYYPSDPLRPKDFFPRLDAITLYSMVLERVTGKETVLPAVEARFPALDQTRSPGAVPPRR